MRLALLMMGIGAALAGGAAHAQHAAYEASEALDAGDCAKAVPRLEALAKQKSPDGLKLVGDMYFLGQCKAADKAKGFALYLQAANLGNAVAQYDVGLAYQNGDQVAQDDGQAARWYGMALAQGYVKAQSNMAVLYLTGRGVGRDIARGVALTEKAALQGYAPAQDNLGKCAATAWACRRTEPRRFPGTARRPGKRMPGR